MVAHPPRLIKRSIYDPGSYVLRFVLQYLITIFLNAN